MKEKGGRKATPVVAPGLRVNLSKRGASVSICRSAAVGLYTPSGPEASA